MTDNGLLERIDKKLDTLTLVANGLPTEDRVRVIVQEEVGIAQQNCFAFKGFGAVSKQSSENAGILSVIKRYSIAPASRAATSLPRWAQITIGILSASGVGGALVAFFSK